MKKRNRWIIGNLEKRMFVEQVARISPRRSKKPKTQTLEQIVFSNFLLKDRLIPDRLLFEPSNHFSTFFPQMHQNLASLYLEIKVSDFLRRDSPNWPTALAITFVACFEIPLPKNREKLHDWPSFKDSKSMEPVDETVVSRNRRQTIDHAAFGREETKRRATKWSSTVGRKKRDASHRRNCEVASRKSMYTTNGRIFLRGLSAAPLIFPRKIDAACLELRRESPRESTGEIWACPISRKKKEERQCAGGLKGEEKKERKKSGGEKWKKGLWTWRSSGEEAVSRASSRYQTERERWILVGNCWKGRKCYAFYYSKCIRPWLWNVNCWVWLIFCDICD